MNLADSMKWVLKKRSQDLFVSFWKDDLKVIVNDLHHDLGLVVKFGPASIKNLKQKGISGSLNELKDLASDALIVFKILPARVKQGFYYFKDDLTVALENLPDQKQKTIFSLKILGMLTSFTIGTMYSIKRGKTEFSLVGLKRGGVLAQFIAAELVFKLSQLFVFRFLNELESILTNQEDIKNVNYFKNLISSKEQLENLNAFHNASGVDTEQDLAFKIVERLKTFIMTGKRA